MQEKQISVKFEGATPTAGAWDVGTIAAALKVLPETTSDLALGDGVAFRLGNTAGKTLLEVFPTGPRAPVVRITGEDLQLSLFRQTDPPQVAPEGLIFETPQGTRWLSLGATGETTIFYDPERARSPQARRNPAERPDHHQTIEMPATGDSGGETTYQRSLPETRQERQPRVTYAGRLGADPACRTTPQPKEVLVCTFPVAEKREGVEKPTWRKTVTFRDLAAKVQQTLKKGMFVEVVGYEHEKTRMGRDGKSRTDTEVYAVSVQHR